MDINDIPLPEDIQAIKTRYNVEQLEQLDSADFASVWEDIQTLLEAFENEYRDVLMLCHHVSRVYDHITCSQISKPNTVAEQVIVVADDVVQDIVDDAIEDATLELRNKIIQICENPQHRTEHSLIRMGKFLDYLRSLVKEKNDGS